MCNKLNRNAASQRQPFSSTCWLDCNTDHVTETEREGGREGEFCFHRGGKRLKNHKQAAVKPQSHWLRNRVEFQNTEGRGLTLGCDSMSNEDFPILHNTSLSHSLSHSLLWIINLTREDSDTYHWVQSKDIQCASRGQWWWWWWCKQSCISRCPITFKQMWGTLVQPGGFYHVGSQSLHLSPVQEQHTRWHASHIQWKAVSLSQSWPH